MTSSIGCSNAVPSGYECGNCRRTGVKLWRRGATLTPSALLCAYCGANLEGVDVNSIRVDGTRLVDGGRDTDQIGGLVPAVPTATNDGFWGYGGIPAEAYAWWRQLPV
ncbi:MAG TPA: hypothetical protein VFT59_05285 [Candidatus Saccharimonadales bacterium]|nr:hypothetical protein [Candidatus Saccharimonadales bacterium]